MEENVNNPVQSSTIPKPSTLIQPTSSEIVYVGFWKRFLAYCVDSIVLVTLSMIFSIPLAFITRVAYLSNGISLLLSASYIIGFWILWDGQTPGKKLLAIKIVRDNGEKMDFVTGLLRYIGYIVSSIILYLGFIWIAFDAKKEGWHDKIAKTHVIKTDGKSHTGIAILIVVVGFIIMTIFMTLAATAIIGALFIGNKALQNAQMESQFDADTLMQYENLQDELQTDIQDGQYTQEEIDAMELQAQEQLKNMSEELEKYGVEFPTEVPAE